MDEALHARIERTVRAKVRALVRMTKDRQVGILDEEDLVQEVLLYLYRDDAAVLRKYDPARGNSSWAGFVAMHTKFYFVTLLRKQSHREALAPTEPLPPNVVDEEGQRLLEQEIGRKMRLVKVADCVRSKIRGEDEKGWVQYVLETPLSDEKLQQITGRDKAWVQRFRGRVRDTAHRCIDALFGQEDVR